MNCLFPDSETLDKSGNACSHVQEQLAYRSAEHDAETPEGPMTTTPSGPNDTSALDSDVAQLHALGYAQELRRRMGGFSNFAVSFTIISVLSGCLTLYYFGMEYGGPVDIVWGWVIVGIMTTIVGLGMAEIASAYPTAGGLYYWSAKLSKKNPGAWSWFTGWFNLLGQVAITAGIDYGFATFFTVFLNLTEGYKTTAGYVLIIYPRSSSSTVCSTHLASGSFPSSPT
jgi:amino acid transporter